MKKLIVVTLMGLVVLMSFCAVFYFYVGMGKDISTNGSDWSNFGAYYGGVAAPVLSFISIILLVYTINQQSEANEIVRDETTKLDMLRYMSGSEQEIDSWLKTELALNEEGKTLQLGLIVWGVVKPTYVNQQELGACLERLLKLTCSYCSSIALYEANVDPYFIYKQHYSKASELIEFLNRHEELLGQIAGPSLGMCKNLLNEANNA